MVDPLSYILFQPVLHNWCNKHRGMCYPVRGMILYQRALAANRKEYPMWQLQVSSLAI